MGAESGREPSEGQVEVLRLFGASLAASVALHQPEQPDQNRSMIRSDIGADGVLHDAQIAFHEDVVDGDHHGEVETPSGQPDGGGAQLKAAAGLQEAHAVAPRGGVEVARDDEVVRDGRGELRDLDELLLPDGGGLRTHRRRGMRGDDGERFAVVLELHDETRVEAVSKVTRGHALRG